MNLKKLFPKFVHTWYMVSQTYLYDCKKALRYNFTYAHDEENAKANLLVIIHVIEKGLTMPNARTNFGHERIKDMIRGIINVNNFTPPHKQFSYKDCFEIEYALETLNDYLIFHKQRNVEVEPSILELINGVAKKFSYKYRDNGMMQYTFTLDTFFKDANAPFERFARSRHTCRNYIDKEIPDAVFEDVAVIASCSPSSCNRQICKLYVIKDSKLRNKVLAVQGHNRGFGDLASAVIIITSNLKKLSDVEEYQQASINAGFYGMNVLYALHLHKVGACVLNWAYTRKLENAMHKLVPQIKDEEQICMLISCGYPAETFNVARSKRKDIAATIIK